MTELYNLLFFAGGVAKRNASWNTRGMGNKHPEI